MGLGLGLGFRVFFNPSPHPSPSPRPHQVVFFNESIDAKLMRSAKTKLLLAKGTTPLLTTGQMPAAGYLGSLVPAQVRT